jgi:carbamoyl-phosphate synthase large subunit
MGIKVLVTGAGALLGQGVIKCLRMADTRYDIIAVDPDSRAAGLFWADKAYLVPFAVAPDYLDGICEIIERERPQVVLIGTDVELPVLADKKPELDAAYDTQVIVSTPDVIRIADDKWLTYQFLASSGFPIIESALPDGIADLLRECDFPLIVKPRCGARSVGVHKVTNEKELTEALDRVHNPIVQKCVSTAKQEYTSGIVIVDGSVKSVVTMRRDLKDGNTYRAYVEPDSPFNGFLSQVAEKLGGLGSMNFQFRSDNGVPRVFEINARFSGTTPLRAYAGYNEVDHIVRHFVRGDPIPVPVLRPVVILRYWDEVVIEPESLNALARERRMLEPEYQRPAHIPAKSGS